MKFVSSSIFSAITVCMATSAVSGSAGPAGASTESEVVTGLPAFAFTPSSLIKGIAESKKRKRDHSVSSSASYSESSESVSSSSETSRKTRKHRSFKAKKDASRGESVVKRMYSRRHVLDIVDEAAVKEALAASNFQGKSTEELNKLLLEVESSLRNLRALSRYAPGCVAKLERVYNEEIPSEVNRLTKKAEEAKGDKSRVKSRLEADIASLSVEATLAAHEAFAVAEFLNSVSRRKDKHRSTVTKIRRQLQLAQVPVASNPVVVTAPAAVPVEVKPAAETPAEDKAKADDSKAKAAEAKPADTKDKKGILSGPLGYILIGVAVLAVIGLVVFMFNKSS